MASNSTRTLDESELWTDPRNGDRLLKGSYYHKKALRQIAATRRAQSIANNPALLGRIAGSMGSRMTCPTDQRCLRRGPGNQVIGADTWVPTGRVCGLGEFMRSDVMDPLGLATYARDHPESMECHRLHYDSRKITRAVKKRMRQLPKATKDALNRDPGRTIILRLTNRVGKVAYMYYDGICDMLRVSRFTPAPCQNFTSEDGPVLYRDDDDVYGPTRKEDRGRQEGVPILAMERVEAVMAAYPRETRQISRYTQRSAEESWRPRSKIPVYMIWDNHRLTTEADMLAMSQKMLDGATRAQYWIRDNRDTWRDRDSWDDLTEDQRDSIYERYCSALLWVERYEVFDYADPKCRNRVQDIMRRSVRRGEAPPGVRRWLER